MREPDRKPTVRLTGTSDNAFSVLGIVKKALKIAGADDEYIQKFHDEATSGDYNKLLCTAMTYVDVE